MKLLKKVIIAFLTIISLPFFIEISSEPVQSDLITQNKKAPSED
ncbi:hypothetical protein [Macrococcoides caseolyticum]|nr:hypothetical protein [Macrococcus caseolyticus]